MRRAGLMGWTPCMNALRSPRLNRQVVSVAVLTRARRSRGSGLSASISGGPRRTGGAVVRVLRVQRGPGYQLGVGRDRGEHHLGRAVGLAHALLPVAQRGERDPVAV